MTLPLLGNLLAPHEWLVIAGVALLIWGRRLPEVGRSLGKGIIEFKKGLNGIEDEIERRSTLGGSPDPQSSSAPVPRSALPSGYQFDPYTGKPLAPEGVNQPAPPPQTVSQPAGPPPL